MTLVLLSLLSQQQIELDNENPVIIGRKNIRECTDKRVSRNHGKISCTQDGKIILSALHSNPCFFTRNGVPPVLQINKDEEEVLNVGDCLGLLPDSFWFQVAAKESISKNNYQKKPGTLIAETDQCHKPNTVNIEKKKNNSSIKPIDTSESDVKPQKDCKENKALNCKEDSLCNETTTEDSCTPNKDLPTCAWSYGNPEFEKTRRLPLYMYQIDEPKDIQIGSRKTKLSEAPEKGIPKKAKTERETRCHSVGSISTVKLESDLTESSGSLQSDIGAVDNIPWNIPSTSGYGTSQKHSQQNDYKEGYEEEVKEKEHDPEISKRPICQYEDKCYRKNTQHKADFCHPGDADYVPYESRPMCQYGASCYRRNEMHKVEFRHPPRSSEDQGDDAHSLSSSCSCPSPASSLLPVKRRRRKVKRHGVNSEDDNDNSDYDLDDPFINDASSDDYVPGGSDVDEESDAFDSAGDD